MLKKFKSYILIIQWFWEVYHRPFLRLATGALWSSLGTNIFCSSRLISSCCLYWSYITMYPWDLEALIFSNKHISLYMTVFLHPDSLYFHWRGVYDAMVINTYIFKTPLLLDCCEEHQKADMLSLPLGLPWRRQTFLSKSFFQWIEELFLCRFKLIFLRLK